MDTQIIAFDKVEHSKELLPLRARHIGDHVLYVIETGYSEIRAKHLA